MTNFGQELPIKKMPMIEVERSANASEIALWKKSEQYKSRVLAKSFAMRLLYMNVVSAAKIAKQNGFDLNEPELPTIEQRMKLAIDEIEALRRDHCDVNAMTLGVRPANNGTDLDIVQPPTASFPDSFNGIWIPIAIGAVVVAGIIARWAYLEKEVDTISEQYNGVLRRADMNLCADKNSKMCLDWQQTKASGGYAQRTTIIDSIKNNLKKFGSTITSGLGSGLMLAIPIGLLFLLSKTKGK